MPSLGPLPRDLPFLQNKLSDRWESRREKLVNQIVDLDPDVVSLVTLGIRMGPLVISMSQLWSQVELDDHAFFGQSLEGEWDPDFRISFLSHAATVRVQPHGHPRAIPGPSVRTQCSASARAPTARTAAGSSGGVVNSSWWPVRQEPSWESQTKNTRKHKNSRRFRDSWWISMNFMIWVLAASLFGRQGFDMIDGNDVSCPCFVPVLRQWENHQPWDLSGFPIVWHDQSRLPGSLELLSRCQDKGREKRDRSCLMVPWLEMSPVVGIRRVVIPFHSRSTVNTPHGPPICEFTNSTQPGIALLIFGICISWILDILGRDFFNS